MSNFLTTGEPRTIVVNPETPGSSLSFALPPGVSISVESVLAAIDTSAALATTALLEIADSSGAVIARKRQSEAVDAGGTGSATWALRLDDKAAAPVVGSLPAAYVRFTNNQVIPPGVQTILTGATFQTNDPTTFVTLGNGIGAIKYGVYLAWAHVSWIAGNYPKISYIDSQNVAATIAPGAGGQAASEAPGATAPVNTFNAANPTIHVCRNIVTAPFFGSIFPTSFNTRVRVMQTSGVNKIVNQGVAANLPYAEGLFMVRVGSFG